MRKELLRVGLLGASKASLMAWLALHRVGYRVTYIGCRNPSRGEALAKKVAESEDGERNGIPIPGTPAIGNYMDVIRSSQVDVVYISLPTSQRAAWVRACAQYGKHVVGEKPAASTAEELRVMLEELTMKRLLFMDGTRLSHGQRVDDVCRAVKELGGPQHIHVNLSFPATEAFFKEDIRVQPLLEPHGALGDLGWYGIRWILHLMDFVLPTSVAGRVTDCSEAWPPPPLPPKSPEEKPELKKEAATAADGPSTSETAPQPNLQRLETPPPLYLGKQRYPAITGFEGTLFFDPHSPSPDSLQTPLIPPYDGETKEAGLTRRVTATLCCSFNECHDQTLEVYCAEGVVSLHGAINPIPEERPCFTIRHDRFAPPPPSASTSRKVGEEEKVAFQCNLGITTERDDTVFSSAPEEVDKWYQAEQLWRHVGDAVMRLGKGEPLIASADHAKRWSSYAYLTQVVMDQLLESAKQNMQPSNEGQ